MSVPTFDPSNFSNEPHEYILQKPWGHELHWTPKDKPHAGKILHIKAGKRLSLQIHDQKQESWLIMSGRAKVVWQDNKGELIETELLPHKGYSCCIGQQHRLVGITDCYIIEVSTPEIGTTYRLEDDFARPDETESLRHVERSK